MTAPGFISFSWGFMILGSVWVLLFYRQQAFIILIVLKIKYVFLNCINLLFKSCPHKFTLIHRVLVTRGYNCTQSPTMTLKHLKTLQLKRITHQLYGSTLSFTVHMIHTYTFILFIHIWGHENKTMKRLIVEEAMCCCSHQMAAV